MSLVCDLTRCMTSCVSCPLLLNTFVFEPALCQSKVKYVDTLAGEHGLPTAVSMLLQAGRPGRLTVDELNHHIRDIMVSAAVRKEKGKPTAGKPKAPAPPDSSSDSSSSDQEEEPRYPNKRSRQPFGQGKQADHRRRQNGSSGRGKSRGKGNGGRYNRTRRDN